MIRLFLFLLLMQHLESKPVEHKPKRYTGYTKIGYGKAVTNNGDTIKIKEISDDVTTRRTAN